jgi:hypothetical protein
MSETALSRLIGRARRVAQYADASPHDVPGRPNHVLVNRHHLHCLDAALKEYDAKAARLAAMNGKSPSTGRNGFIDEMPEAYIENKS